MKCSICSAGTATIAWISTRRGEFRNVCEQCADDHARVVVIKKGASQRRPRLGTTRRKNSPPPGQMCFAFLGEISNSQEHKNDK